MSWLDFFQTTESPCKSKFGRGIGAKISPDEEELFNKSFQAFENKKILDAYEYFLKSLLNFTNGVDNKNIVLEKTDTQLTFEIYQGLARINGVISKESCYAEVNIAKTANASVALKRYILERNYQFTYINYFSDATDIKLKLYQDNIALSPQKIFFPLRELALNADFDKEHIQSEFKNTLLEDTAHIQKIDSFNAIQMRELEVKYKSLQEWIVELEEKVLTLPSNDNVGMHSFIYLNFLFKVDYLLAPKFTLYQELSKKVQEYFSNENSTIESKNEEIKQYITTLKKIQFEEFKECFYEAKYTFNPIEKSSYDDIVIFINESQKKIHWYTNNRYMQVIPTIYNYIALYSLYNYGMNPLLRELFHILIEVQNSNFFQEIACEPLYSKSKETFMKKVIIKRINTLVQLHTQKYKNLSFATQELNFTSMNAFCASYYALLKNLDFEEA